MPKVTAPQIASRKGGSQKIVCITAYDAIFGAIADESGADVVLVGDSVGNTVMGQKNMLGVSLEDIVHYTRCVAQGVRNALLVSDLPFGSYQEGPSQAVQSAIALVKAGAEAVKIEGNYLLEIEAIVKAGIPVMGHVGMTPQSVHAFGGFKVQGRENADIVLQAAQQVANAGVFSVVLELIPADLACKITGEIMVPTIGIGAGRNCDGEIQVIYDVLGLSQRVYKHTRPFLDGHTVILSALSDYVRCVRDGSFPSKDNEA